MPLDSEFVFDYSRSVSASALKEHKVQVSAAETCSQCVQLGELVPELWNRWEYDLIAKMCKEKHDIDIYDPKASATKRCVLHYRSV